MEFRASFCNPFKKEIIELGDIRKEHVIEKFHSIQWDDFLKRMDSTGEEEIYYSPSLEIENKSNGNSLTISKVDNDDWYIFFKRPKTVKRFFGLIEKLDEDYLTDITGQSESKVLEYLHALLKNDLDFLESKIK